MRTRLVMTTFLCFLATAVAVAQESEGTNKPPEGFIPLFNGESLAGWIGMNMDPSKLRAMPAEERTKLLEKNWAEVEKHWSVENGELVNDGQGPYLTTAKDYGDFELRLEYKTVAKADSGIYLRGTPQVQIWDTTKEGGKWEMKADKGSGGLFNNQKTPNTPLALADKPFGEWNSMVITLVGDAVTVVFNDKLVVNEQVMENYWDRSKELFPVGPIQLQTHGGEIRFRNVYLKEIPRKPPESGYLAADGTPYGDGWEAASEENVKNLRNFDLHVTTKASADKAGALAFRASGGEDGPAMLLTVSPEHGVLLSDRKDGEPYNVASTPFEASGLKAGEPNHIYLRVKDDHFQAWINETPVLDVLYPHGPESGEVRGSTEAVESVFVRDAKNDERVGMFEGGEEGFTPIFNGQDLSGWTGDTKGYAAEPNVLKSKPKAGGNLYYDKELSNFVFRFEFKLDEGGNNGVGIRVPKGAGATAYEGMESQILDNTSPQYATIKPYQAHGSIYGIVPAKRGYLNPVGHWNAEEIIVEGDHIKVILNGKVIVDANLKEALKDGKTVDGREHPGLNNKSGYLGFLGHGHEIEFRNLRVKTLD